MDKIIFLDIDGVLNVYDLGRDQYGNIFHTQFENNLHLIIQETGASIVISSSWRTDGLKTMQNMWKERGLPGNVIDITPNEYDLVKRGLFQFYDNVKRGDEIQLWIDDNDVKNYVIIDDDNDMLPSQQNNFVQTSDNIDHPDCVDIGYGLTRICAEKAIKILNKYHGVEIN